MKEFKILSLKDVKDYTKILNSAQPEEYIQIIQNSFTWPEGFWETLKDLPLEEQMEYYKIDNETSWTFREYDEVSTSFHTSTYALKDYKKIEAFIAENGVLLGVCIKPFPAQGYPLGYPVFPDDKVCTYHARDDDGTSSSSRSDYARLCCIMPGNR